MDTIKRVALTIATKHVFDCMNVSLHVCMCVRACVHEGVSACVRACVRASVCVYMHNYIYACT